MNLQMHLNWAVICRSVLCRHDDSARRFRLCQEFEHGLAARVGWGPCVQHNSNGRGAAGAAVSVSVFVERSAGYVGENTALPDGREHFQLYGEARAAAASTAMRSGASGQRHGARAGCVGSRLGASGDSVRESSAAGSLGGALPGGGRIPARLSADCRRASSEGGARDNLRESRPWEAYKGRPELQSGCERRRRAGRGGEDRSALRSGTTAGRDGRRRRGGLTQ